MNIRQARKKIKSVGNVKKITKAMQLVSVIKMKKAQQLAIEGRPYQIYLEAIIRKIVSKIDTRQSELISRKSDGVKKKDLAIVVTSNKGLCGGFNMNLFRHILKTVDFKTTDFAILGKKATLLGKFGGNIIADFSSNYPLENVSALFNLVLSKYLDKTYSNVYIYYNLFVSTLRVDPTKETLLPIELLLDTPEKESSFAKVSKDEEQIESENEYLVEPSPEEIIDSLLKSFVQEKIQHTIIQSEAGEHSSRMIAMKSATENANDVIYNLTMLRNKLRQEKITNELLDMVTAKESVESS